MSARLVDNRGGRLVRVSPLKERARGRWRSILPALGIDPSYLTGKNGPCPLCPSGRDRWRFLDTNGDGTWICTHCGSDDGIALVGRFLDVAFREAAERIERSRHTIPTSETYRVL